MTRRFNRREAESSLLIIDSHSVRKSNQPCSKGIDGNKKIEACNSRCAGPDSRDTHLRSEQA
jgi:hypothetical protein